MQGIEGLHTAGGKVVRSSDVSSSLAKPDGSELRCFFEVIRCVELRNWPAFYTSDKLLRLRQQKMYLMKKDSVTL
jgi:hypothetical protein